jgi:hypothetical protein
MKHLVEMHKKYGDKGLVVVTVSIDPLKEKDLVQQANKALREIAPPFRNLLLDETPDFIEKRLGFVFPPSYFVFDRRGKWMNFRVADDGTAVDKAAMDRVILQLLDDK